MKKWSKARLTRCVFFRWYVYTVYIPLCFLFTIFTFLTCPESSFLILLTFSLLFQPPQRLSAVSITRTIHLPTLTSSDVTPKGNILCTVYQMYIYIYMYFLIREVLRIYIYLFFWIYINTLHFKTSMSFQSIERFVDEAWNWTCFYAVRTSIPQVAPVLPPMPQKPRGLISGSISNVKAWRSRVWTQVQWHRDVGWDFQVGTLKS